MYFILLLLIMVAVLILFIFRYDLQTKLVFDTCKSDMHATILWLYPFIKIIAEMENSAPVLNIYVFKKHFATKHLKKGKGKFTPKDGLNIAEPHNVCIITKYGFRNPSATGITCGVINFASQFIYIDSFYNDPDFMSSNDFFYLEATANVNLGTALINLLRHYKNRRKIQWIRAQA